MSNTKTNTAPHGLPVPNCAGPTQMPAIIRPSKAWGFAREMFPRIPFPWGVLPANLSESMNQLARSCAGPASAIIGSAFAIVASAVGRSISVSPKFGWEEPSIIWHGDIRDSGSGKTAPLWKLAAPLVRAQRFEDEQFKDKMRAWNSLPKKEKEKQEQPIPPRGYFCTNLTMEGLHKDMDGHPTGGIAIIMSELSAIISGQNQYKKGGNDREALLTLHDGHDARIIRACKPTVTIRGARPSIVGGLQPQVFSDIFSANRGQLLTDGTIFRFLFSYEPPTHYPSTPEGWSENNSENWTSIIEQAHKWADNRQDERMLLLLNEEAKNIFFSWRNDLDSQRIDLPDAMRGFMAKAFGYALRLTGIIHLAHCFSTGVKPSPLLGPEDIRRGIEVVSFYLGQAVDCMATFDSEANIAPPQEVSERTLILAQVLEILRPEIDNGRLAVGFIMNRFNDSAPKEQQFKSAKSFCGLLRSVNLTITASKHDANGHRSSFCLKWDKITETLLQTLQTRKNNCLCHENVGNTHKSDFADINDDHIDKDMNLTRDHDSRECENISLQSLQCLSAQDQTHSAGADIVDQMSAMSVSNDGENPGYPVEFEI